MSQRHPESIDLLRKLIVDQAVNFRDWFDLDTVKLPANNDSLIRPLLANNILINRRGTEYKFKNALTKDVVMSKLETNSQNENCGQN